MYVDIDHEGPLCTTPQPSLYCMIHRFDYWSRAPPVRYAFSLTRRVTAQAGQGDIERLKAGLPLDYAEENSSAHK